MKFGFDVDDTLINLREHAFHLYNKKLKKNIPIETFRELKTLTIHKPFGLTDVEGRQMWMDLREDIYFTDCPPFPLAMEVLQELEQEGHEIYYVTSRDGRYCERTKEWLRKAGFPVHDDRFFCGMQDPEKVRIIKEIGVDYYFDDKPAVLETLMNSGAKVYVKNHPYNQHLDFPRIDSWSELKEIFLKSKG
jgi:uncharacterized protein